MKVEQKLSIIFLNIDPANKGNKMPQLSPYTPVPINCVSAPWAAALKKPRIFPILRPRRTRVRVTGHAARVEGGAARVYISYHSYQWPGPCQLGGRLHARREQRDIQLSLKYFQKKSSIKNCKTWRLVLILKHVKDKTWYWYWGMNTAMGWPSRGVIQ